MKKFTKILSVLCVLALLASVISVGFVTNAAITGANSDSYSVGSDGTYTSVYGVNHLGSASLTTTYTDPTADPAAYNTSMTCFNWALPVSALTNGLADDSYNGYQAGKWVTNYVGVKTKYHQYDFTLASGLNNPETFLVAQQTGSGEIPSNYYEVWFAKTAEELETANPVITWNSTSTAEQVFDISDADLTGVKHVRIRFYHLANGCITKFKEIGLYGGVSELTINSSLTSDENGSYDSVYGTNNLVGSTITYNIVETTNPTINGSHYPTANIIDGSSETLNQIQISSAVGSATDYTQTSEYMDIVFALPSSINNPQKFLISYRNPTGESSMHYAIYASSSKDTLFSNEVYKYSSASNNGQENIIDLSAKKLANISYFAIRFYNLPIWGTCVLPREIALYGGKSVFAAAPTLTSDSNGSYAAYGDNKLTSATASYTIVDSGNPNQTWSSDTQNPIKNSAIKTGLVDNTSASFAHIQPSNAIGSASDYTQTAEYIEIKYDLGAYTTSLQKLLLSFRNPGEASQHYAFFASKTEDVLFEKPVYEFSASSVANQQEHHYDLSSLNLSNIRYFAIRFYHLNSGGYLLLREIALYEKAIETNGPKLKINYVSTAKDGKYESNLLSGRAGAMAEYINNNHTYEYGTTPGFTDTLTDRHLTSGHAEEHQAANDAIQTHTYHQLTYSLDKTESNIGKFFIAFAPSEGAQYTSQHYAVYLSTTKEDLYTNGLVYEYQTLGGTGVGVEHEIDLSTLELNDIQYVGIRFYNRCWGVYGHHQFITEIGLYKQPIIVDLKGSVYKSDDENSNDIQYRLSMPELESGAITDAGIIAGFKVNIDADEAFEDDYAKYLKEASNSSAITKASVPSEFLDSSDIYFHIANSGTHAQSDNSGYRICAIAYVTVEDNNGQSETYWSNIIDKSSMQISRNQAKSYVEKSGDCAKIAKTDYSAYDFATNGTIDIATVRTFNNDCSEVPVLTKKLLPLDINSKEVKLVGRVYDIENGIGVDNSAAGIEFNAYCQGDVIINVNCNGEYSLNSWGASFVVVVDGEITYDVLPSTHIENGVLTIAKGLETGNHSFGVYRMNPSACDFISIELNGEFKDPPAKKDKRIAFIGASTTVGHYSTVHANTTDGAVITDYDGTIIKDLKAHIFNKSNNEIVATYDFDYLQRDNTNYYVENTTLGIDLTYPIAEYGFYIEYLDYDGKSLGRLADNVWPDSYKTNSYDTFGPAVARQLNADWDVMAVSGITIEKLMGNNMLTTQTYRDTSVPYVMEAPDVFIIEAAINSYYYAANADNFAAAMESAVKFAKSLNPDCKVIFTTGGVRTREITKYVGLDPNWANYTVHADNCEAKAKELNDIYGDVHLYEFGTARDGGLNHPSMSDYIRINSEIIELIENNG